jgi:hypothetical protein
MKKNLSALIQNLLKISLFSSIILLFSLVAVQGNIKMSYAKNPHSGKAKDSSDATTLIFTPTPILTPTPTPTPTLTPTPTPTLTPTPRITPASTQQQVPVSPLPTTVLPINPMTTANLTTATPVGIPQSATPTTLIATPTSTKTRVLISTPPHLQNTRDNGINAFTLSLALGFAAPLLMITAGALWLLVRWQIKRQKLVLEKETQASPWINSSDIQASFHSLQSASSAALNATIPSTSIVGTAPISIPPAQPTYTASDLHPITLALPQQMFPGVAHYPPNGDLRPLSMHSLDLFLEVTRPIELNGNGYMSLLPDAPTGLADVSTSSMPSSPPKPVVLSIPPSTIKLPAAKDHSMPVS